MTGTAVAAPAAPEGLKRARHWETRAFAQFLAARAKMPFAWGTNDCALFCADGILALTGVDIAAAFRGKYADEASALAAIQIVCGGSTVADAAAWCAAQHGLAAWDKPLHAQRGDLVIAQNAAGPTAALVHLSGACLVTAGEGGTVRLPLRSILRAWHVGPASTPAQRAVWHVPPAWKAHGSPTIPRTPLAAPKWTPGLRVSLPAAPAPERKR